MMTASKKIKRGKVFLCLGDDMNVTTITNIYLDLDLDFIYL